jgi:Trk K+ transport system NAD-binding subunit
VVLDPSEERISKLSVKKYNKKILSLVADYSALNFIKMAGVDSGRCLGVFIVGNKEVANKQALVICNSFGANTIVRAQNKLEEKEYSLAGATHILNLNSLTILPIYNIFRRPSLFILASMLDEEIFDTKQEIDLPRVGKWAIWGRGKMVGKITEILSKVGNDVWVIPDVSNESIEEIPEDIIGLVVSGDDLGNITLINKIRDKNSEIYTIAVSEKYTLSELYEQININLLIKPWLLFVEQAFTFISEPLIKEMLIYLSKSPKAETDRLVSKIVDIYVNNEDNANTWSETLDEGMYVQDFMQNLGDERDHVLLFSKDKKMDFEDDWLKPGDTILVASRFYTKK